MVYLRRARHSSHGRLRSSWAVFLATRTSTEAAGRADGCFVLNAVIEGANDHSPEIGIRQRAPLDYAILPMIYTKCC